MTRTDTDAADTERDAPPAASGRRAELIREHFRETGVPPSPREVADRATDASVGYYRPEVRSWADVLRAAGVPAYEDVVGDYLRECFDARHDWQEFVTTASKRIARETNLSPQKVREAMQELRGANAEGALAGFSVGRVTDAHRPNWKVERTDGGGDEACEDGERR